MILTRYFGNWNTQIIQVALPFPLSLGVSSLVSLIFLDVEQVFLWSPQDQLHSRHLVDGLEQSLLRCPSASQLKHPVKCFTFSLENASMCSSSLLSSQLLFTAPMSMVFWSGVTLWNWKWDDELVIGKKPVLPLWRKFMVSIISLIVRTDLRYSKHIH